MSRQRILAADLFCGAGGTSLGMAKACQEMGFDLDLIAINHWPVAISTHSANHPYAKTLCESLDQVDPRKLVPGGRLNLLVASPECTHHSVARGGRPMNDQSRASAWTVCRWAENLYIDNIIIENVKEFRTWGPLGVEKRPIRKLRGKLYFNFLDALRSLGYRVEDKIINCADYGDPTTRERLFIIARRGQRKILWPRPTHCAPEKLQQRNDGLFNEGLKPWVPARDIIDWTIPGKSIFNRKKPLALKTLQRIYAGLEKFGGPNAKPFLIVLRQHMNAQSLDMPIPTLTANGNHVALVEPIPFVIGTGGPEYGAKPVSIDEPFKTLLTDNRKAIVEPIIVNMKGKSTARSLGDPLPTQTTNSHLYVAEPMILDHPRKNAGATPVSQPLKTVTATSSDFALVDPIILPHNVFDQSPADSIDRPLRTLVGKNARQVRVCEPVIVPFFGERDGQEPRAHSVDDPLPTVTSHGAGAVVEPYIVAFRGDHAGMTDGSRRVHSVDEPLRTQDCSNRFAIAEPCIVKYNGTATATSVQEPLHTISTKGSYALVTTDEGTFALDIRLRMLKTHELAAAMSMKGYVFHGKMEEQVKQIGNAVPTETAKALITEVLQ